MTHQSNSNIFYSHRILNPRRGLIFIPQSGGGLGDLFKNFIKWLIPAGKTLFRDGVELVKGAAETELGKDVTETIKKNIVSAGVDLAQTALKGGDVKKKFKDKTRDMRDNLSETITLNLKENLDPVKKKRRKPIDNLG